MGRKPKLIIDESISIHIRQYMDVYGVKAMFLAEKIGIGRTTLYRKLESGVYRYKDIDKLREIDYFNDLFKKTKYAYLKREDATSVQDSREDRQSSDGA